MQSRTAKFVSAFFASVLAGTPLATISHNAARAADDCLSGPKDQTPEGSHWYYRIDRGTKRHCWYLREEGEKLSQTAPPNAPQSAKPDAPTAETPTPRSVADAHAELPAQTRIEQPSRDGKLTPSDIAIRENFGVTGTSAAGTPRSVVASRWPNPSDAIPSANPAPNQRDPVASADPTPQTQPPSVPADGQLAAADVSLKTSVYSVQVKLATLTGALALAGIVGGVIFKLANLRRPRPRKIRARRKPIWEPTGDDAVVLSDHPGAGAFSYRGGFARDRTGDRNERIDEFFAQLSKRYPT